jgi:RNA polymerase sigma-70 factor, ECF subfamily
MSTGLFVPAGMKSSASALSRGDVMVEQFETYRTQLFSIAYRMLGSAMDAEDIVQEAYLHAQSTPTESIKSYKAFLTTIVTRLCINQLNSAHPQRETYPGPWLPEPLLTADHPDLVNPENHALAYESISMAFLVLLESLKPVERAVFLLREVFDYDYPEIADIVSKNESACRQLFRRAKKHVTAKQPRFKSTPEKHRQMLDSFLQAVEGGELTGLMSVLAEDVVLWADSGGKVKGAATRPVAGRDAVARFSLGTRRFLPEDYRVEIAEVNGQPALIYRVEDRALLVLTIDLVPVGNALDAKAGPSSDRDGSIDLVPVGNALGAKAGPSSERDGSIEVEAQHICAIRIVANPEKLARV